jgi:flagellar biosynthetic protein FliQ
MHEAEILNLARRAIIVTLELTMPVLIATLVVGVIVSLFQAVTQIQEQTLTFVPKILVFVLTIVFLGPWMLQSIVVFTSGLFAGLPHMIH